MQSVGECRERWRRGDQNVAPATEAEQRPSAAYRIPSNRQKGKTLEPSHRFQTRYHRHRCRREQGETSQYWWMVDLIGGPALIAAGFAFLPTPGPSFIIIVIGLWMHAGGVIP